MGVGACPQQVLVFVYTNALLAKFVFKKIVIVTLKNVLNFSLSSCGKLCLWLSISPDAACWGTPRSPVHRRSSFCGCAFGECFPCVFHKEWKGADSPNGKVSFVLPMDHIVQKISVVELQSSSMSSQKAISITFLPSNHLGLGESELPGSARGLVSLHRGAPPCSVVYEKIRKNRR